MGKITFDHAVIYNGEFYPAGAEIETKEPEKEPKKPAKKGGVKNDKETV